MLSERGTYAFAASPCSCRANLQPYRPNLACSKKASERPISDCACPHVLLCLSIRLLPLIEVTPKGNLYAVLTTSLYLCHYASCLNGVQLLPTLLRDHPSIVGFRIKSSILPSKRHFFSLYSCKLGIANLYHQNHLLLLLPLLLLDKHQRMNTCE